LFAFSLFVPPIFLILHSIIFYKRRSKHVLVRKHNDECKCAACYLLASSFSRRPASVLAQASVHRNRFIDIEN
jgi:hypothetical protein